MRGYAHVKGQVSGKVGGGSGKRHPADQKMGVRNTSSGRKHGDTKKGSNRIAKERGC